VNHHARPAFFSLYSFHYSFFHYSLSTRNLKIYMMLSKWKATNLYSIIISIEIITAPALSAVIRELYLRSPKSKLPTP
jgi:hypothetical protein